MPIKTVLNDLRSSYTNERDKGTAFEKLMIGFFNADPLYNSIYKKIWTWGDFTINHPEYDFNAKDIGIDLVAQLSSAKNTQNKAFCAIQCKFYGEDHILKKEDIDSFFTLSGKKPFIERSIIVTTNNISSNVDKSFDHQTIPVTLITLDDLEKSNINWLQFDINNIDELPIKPKKIIRPHQKEALDKATEYYKNNDRGKLVMACGTGKTYTTLKIAEAITPENANILFLVPSLSLLSQTLKEWNYEADNQMDSYAVCSDSKIGKDEDLKLHELSFPATTNTDTLLKNFDNSEKNNKRTVIFSTYQSLDVIKEAQIIGLPEFDLIICDEAHRTTGIKGNKIKDDSNFVMVHDNNKVRAKKRLYMTATPRIYTPNVISSAKKREIDLCSMDDENIYGKVFYTLNFSKAVELDLLSDYQVMVLMVSEDYINGSMQPLFTGKDNTLILDDVSKIVGCYNGLAKKGIDTETKIYFDENPMKRAVMFAGRIDVSKRIASGFKKITSSLGDLRCEAKHIDGNTNVLERNKCLDWLKDPMPDGECRIISNARCLSEGVDVPALDAVIFLNPKDSEIDTIQSIGRVMRKSPGKKYGYIILPVVIPVNDNPEDVLKKSNYDIVWKTLESLRAHDEKIDKEINQLRYNGQSDKIHVIGVKINTREESLPLVFPEDKIKMWKDAIHIKIVEKCGDKEYIQGWTKDISDIIDIHIARINEILKQNKDNLQEFDNFLSELRSNINPAVSSEDAVTMLSQHLITKPVFEVLFESEFAKKNPISLAMDKVIAILDEKGLKNETVKLERFYESVKNKVSAVKNFSDKQKIIIELYNNFFSLAVPKSSEKLGIVYTPVEIVDFILNSVEYILKEEFGSKLENENVHILDPFTGTGTFITRLIQNGLINKEKLESKYKNELHANEIMLLAYYIAAINIEETYRNLSEKYEPFTGIVLTDTFQMLEEEYKTKEKEGEFEVMDEDKLYPLKINSKRALKQKQQDIRVIIGNPPYSASQKNANDNNKNDQYPRLDKRIVDTYAKYSNAQNKQNLHDSYVRAFRWATDRIKDKGVVCFISNGSYINGKAFDGFRETLLDEFTSVYCFNLKGNVRAFNRDEGENVFYDKCSITVAVTLLIKNLNSIKNNHVFYYEIGDRLKTEDKLQVISNLKSIKNIKWQEIIPNETQDWIKQRSPVFSDFIPLGDRKNENEKTIFNVYSMGIGTNRDSWCYNFSKERLGNNIESMIDFYNGEVARYNNEPDIDNFVNNNQALISWSRGLKKRLKNKKELKYDKKNIISAAYRPFCKQWLYYNGTRELNEEIFQFPRIFPDKNSDNIIICTNGIGDTKYTCIITNEITDLHSLYLGTQAFPLYYYKKIEAHEQVSLFKSSPSPGPVQYEKIDNIRGEFLEEIQDKYNDSNITKEDIFYYIYGILHNENYRKTFANDLTKMLPRIPFIKNFKRISDLGKKLANLHLNYETIEPYAIKETISEKAKDLPEEELYHVTKMKFGRKDKEKDKSIIIYNDYITLSDIPPESYNYIVNGKSAIEWIMSRYKVSVDKKTGIKNDPNDLLKESGNHKYIVDLIKRIVGLSIQSITIMAEISKYSVIESKTETDIDKNKIIEFPAKFDILSDADIIEDKKYAEYLPVYSSEAAATKFSDEEYIERTGWIRVKTESMPNIESFNYPSKLNKDMFIAKVVGKSMEPTIPDGSYCIFRFERGGSRNGKVVIVESRKVPNPEINQKFTVKRYKSEKEDEEQSLNDQLSRLPENDDEYSKEGRQWVHKRIILSPDNKEFEDIILENASEDDYRVIAEFVAVIGTSH